jgi:hypothetical protein
MTRPPTASERQRLRSFGNLWRALIPLMFVVGLLVVLTWPRGTRGDGIHVVDTVGPIAAAREAAGFDVPAPDGLASGWRPTSTEFVPSGDNHGASFRIGYVTPSGEFAEFLASDDAPPAVTAQYGPITGDGSADIGGQKWSKYVTSKNRTLFARTSGRVTVVVTGSATDADLQTLAGSLKVKSGAGF